MRSIVLIYLGILFLGVVTSVLLLRVSGKIVYINSLQPMEIISDMDNQKKLKEGYIDKFYNLQSTNKLSGKIGFPLESIDYPFEPHQFEYAEVSFSNPISPSSFSLRRGETLFKRFCVVCHNEDGKGNGWIITKVQLADNEEGFPPPKNLTSQNTMNLSDSRIFHIISSGQNLMFSYNDKLSDFDKWCLIYYIRKLQNLQ